MNVGHESQEEETDIESVKANLKTNARQNNHCTIIKRKNEN